MNPNVPQEVRIINAISEQLFNSWPVSIIMIDLEDCIWRLNQQVMNELQLNEHVIGRHITDLLEVVCDKKECVGSSFAATSGEGCTDYSLRYQLLYT
jgi:hypothetical protein